MVSGTVESHSCVHLILKDGAWVIVRLGWFTAATGLSLFRHHIASFVLIFVTNYMHTTTENRVYDIFVEIFSTRLIFKQLLQLLQNLSC